MLGNIGFRVLEIVEAWKVEVVAGNPLSISQQALRKALTHLTLEKEYLEGVHSLFLEGRLDY